MRCHRVASGQRAAILTAGFHPAPAGCSSSVAPARPAAPPGADRWRPDRSTGGVRCAAALSAAGGYDATGAVAPQQQPSSARRLDRVQGGNKHHVTAPEPSGEPQPQHQQWTARGQQQGGGFHSKPPAESSTAPNHAAAASAGSRQPSARSGKAAGGRSVQEHAGVTGGPMASLLDLPGGGTAPGDGAAQDKRPDPVRRRAPGDIAAVPGNKPTSSVSQRNGVQPGRSAAPPGTVANGAAGRWKALPADSEAVPHRNQITSYIMKLSKLQYLHWCEAGACRSL